MAQAAAGNNRWHRGRGDERGREASRPRDIPARGWWDVTKRVKGQLKEDRLSIIAAGVAFYGLLAIFPALIALVGLYGLAFDPQQVEQQMAALSGMLPPQAAEIILGQLRDLTQTSSGALGLGAIAGLLLALWSASAGVRTLMEALNVAYDEEERRGAVRFYGTAILLTLAAIVGVMLAIGLIVALPIVVGFLGLTSLLEGVVSYARWPILAILMLAGLAVVYRYGPSRNEPRWRWVSWGAVIAMLLWVVGSALFSLYVTQFGNYNKTYGSMGAVVILLMWFLLSAYAILIGAEFNAEAERQTKKDTTRSPEKPMGKRRAYAADTVGESP
jgi:membrane protein